MVRQEPLLPCLRRFPVPTAGKPADSQRSGIAGAWMERRIEGGHFLPQAKPKDCGTAMRGVRRRTVDAYQPRVSLRKGMVSLR